jgi:hypothetical protein
MKSKLKSQFPNKESLSDNDLYETYKGYQIISFQGILLWGGIAFFIYNYISSSRLRKTESLIVGICFSIYLFFLCSWQMNYFQVSENYLRILKHNLFWKKTVYKLSDIQEIVLQKRRNAGNCLKVITTDLDSKFYVASLLTEKTFLDLKDKLESYNITVTDERPQL